MRFLFYMALISVFALCFNPLQGHDIDWKKINYQIFNPYLNLDTFRGPNSINPALLMPIYICVKKHNFKFSRHSDIRFKSYHHGGGACDFNLAGDYEGLDKQERLLQFKKDLKKLRECLQDLGLMEIVGLGIYPQSYRPFFHLDIRGEKGRWGRINGNYVTYEIAYVWLMDQINKDIIDEIWDSWKMEKRKRQDYVCIDDLGGHYE